jgi:PAS domain S-box-containing protein
METKTTCENEQRKRAIENLGPFEAANVLTQFLDLVPWRMGVVEVTPETIFHLMANKETERHLGLSRFESWGRTGEELGTREEVASWREKYEEAKLSGRPVQLSYPQEKAGELRWLQFTIRHMGKGEKGGDLYSYIGEDITEKRVLTESLKSEQERFRLAVAGANAGLWDWDVSTGKVFYSRQWKEMLGYNENDIPDHYDSWEKLVHPDDRATALATIRNYIEGESQDYRLEHRLRCKDGSYRWILTKGACTRDGDGKPVRFTGWHIDIHELRSTVEELRRRDKIIKEQQVKIIASAKMSSLGEMAGGIAHEINNPLAIIALSANQISEALRHKPENQDLIRESLERIGATVLRIGKIVKGLRTFSRSGENDPFEPCSLEQIIGDTLELCTERFSSHGIELRVKPAFKERADCRAVQISQVLLNLLNNAFDAVKDKNNPWVELEVTDEGEDLLFSVTDSGTGIRPEVAAKIMDPFFTTKEVGEGTGLGLSIAKGIVEDHGGTLQLDQDSPHTRFCFRLPKRRRKPVS